MAQEQEPIVTTEEKPIKYKKEYREALRRLNEEKGLSIPESEIPNLNRRTYKGGATPNENESLATSFGYTLMLVRRDMQHAFELKILSIINERTNSNIPKEALDAVKQGHFYTGRNEKYGSRDIYNLYHQIYKELEQNSKKTKEARMVAEGMKICGRCGGSGRYSYNQKDLDKCYGCGGSGVVPIKKKESKGKGWHESPDNTGKAPKHKAVARATELKETLKAPMIQQGRNRRETSSLFGAAKNYGTLEEFIKAQAVKAQLLKDGTKINSDGTVTLYHATLPEIKIKIENEGFIRGGATATGGMTGLALEPSAFFGTDEEWTKQTWGRSGEIIEIKVPAEYLRKPAQNTLEVYFEGGLKRRDDGIWVPVQKPRDTFYNIIAERELINKSQLTDIWNSVHSGR